jgi:hypothetical protein
MVIQISKKITIQAPSRRFLDKKNQTLGFQLDCANKRSNINLIIFTANKNYLIILLVKVKKFQEKKLYNINCAKKIRLQKNCLNNRFFLNNNYHR